MKDKDFYGMEYFDLLNHCWKLHLKNLHSKSKNRPTVISLFSGGGGSSLGYSIAGFKELLAIDFEKVSAEVFVENFPGVEFIREDITKMNSREIMKGLKIKAEELDVLDGSPPCQGFSTAKAGSRFKKCDTRNFLYQDYLRFVRTFRPKVVIMENVTGMMRKKTKPILIDMINQIKKAEYILKVVELNADYFRVPQHRRRLIFIGIRKDLNIKPSYPPPPSKNIFRKTFSKEALDRIPEFRTKCPVYNEKFEKDIFPLILPGLSAVECISQDVLAQYENKFKNKKFNFRGILRRLDSGNVSRTIDTTEIRYSRIPIHFKENRRLNLSELKRLGSFPDQFILPDHFKKGLKIIGNSVPPLFMAKIAWHIKSLLK